MQQKLHECSEVALEANAKIFATWGRTIAHPIRAAVIFSMAIGLFIGLSIGVKHVEFQNRLEKLWVEEGSRSASEFELVDENFGGAGRLTQFVVRLNGPDSPRDSSDHGMLTKERLLGFRDIMKPIINDEKNFTKTMRLSANTTGPITFSHKDFCDRAPVPSVMQKYAFNPLAYNASAPGGYGTTPVVGAYLAHGQSGSGYLHYMTSCLKEQIDQVLDNAAANGAGLAMGIATSSFGDQWQMQLWYNKNLTELAAMSPQELADLKSSTPALPYGWAVDVMPCSRASILDCWADGNFDYPAKLKMLEKFGRVFAAYQNAAILFPGTFGTVYGTWLSTNSNYYRMCKNSAVGKYMSLGMTATQAGITVSVAENFAQLGYWWRPSIDEQIDTLASSFIQSVNNTINYSKTGTLAFECGKEGLARRVHHIVMPTGPGTYVQPYQTSGFGGCCVQFSLLPISSGLFVGGLIPNDVNANEHTSTPFAYTLRLSDSLVATRSQFVQKRLEGEKSIKITLDEQSDLLDEWDNVMIQHFDPMFMQEAGSGFAEGETYDAKGFRVCFLTDRSIRDIFTDAADLEGKLLIIGYVVLVSYACAHYVVYRCPPSKDTSVYSRVILCLSSICFVGFAVLASFGFMGWIGMKLSPINALLVPFLAVALGVDDVFVYLTMVLEHPKYQDNPINRMVLTMTDAGAAITVTLIANAVAFLIPSAFVRLAAVYTFTYHMAAAIIINWICMMCIVSVLIYWDCVRVSKRRSILCFEAPSEEIAVLDQTTDKFSLKNLVRLTLSKLYVNPIFKVLSILFWLGLTAGLGYHGFAHTTNGLKFSDIVLKGSNVREFLMMQEDYYPILPGSVITREINYVDNGTTIDLPKFQSNILQVITDTSKSHYVDQVSFPMLFHWLPSLITFYKSAFSQPSATSVPSNLFYPVMQSWLTLTGVSSVNSLVCKNTTSNELDFCYKVNGNDLIIVATSGFAFFRGIEEDKDYVNAIEDIRKRADNSAGNKDVFGKKFETPKVFFAGSLFNYWQQYVTVREVAIKAVGYSLLGVFVVTLLFQFSLFSSLIVGAHLLATVLQMYGFMAILGIKLNGFSVTNLAVTVGTAVEFTAYVSNSFLRANAKTNDRNQRMILAVEEMFPPMWKGAVTTIISLVCLAFAKYPFFSLYYFQMIAMSVLLSFINGLWFLPIWMSVLSPVGIDKEHRKESLDLKNPKGSTDDILAQGL